MTGKRVDYLEIAEAYEAEAEASQHFSQRDMYLMLLAHARVYRRLAYPKKPAAIEDFAQ